MSVRDGHGETTMNVAAYWDALLRGESPSIQDDDDGLFATARAVDEMRMVPAPAGARARAEQQLSRVTAFPRPMPKPTTQRWPHRWLAVAAGFLLLAVGGAAAWYWSGGDDDLHTVPAAFPVALATPSPDTRVLPVELIWTSEGSTELPFAAPADIELGPDGNVYVYDQGSDSIHVLDPEGNQLSAFGGPGTGDGQFMQTVSYGIYGGLAFDSAGNLYVADPGNHRVQKFDQDHQFLLAWGSEGEGDDQFDEVSAIAIDAVDNVYVLEGGGKGTMKVFDGEGSFLRKFELRTAGGGLLRTARELAIDDQGRIWAVDTEQNRILIYSVEGEYLGNVTIESSPLGLNTPSDIDFDSHGRAFIAEYVASRVQVLDEAGEFLTSWGGVGTSDPMLIVPEGIAVDDEGSVYVIDENRVLKFQLTEDFLP